MKEKLIGLLDQVNHGSLLGLVIQKGLNDNNVETLIRELKSQMKDCPYSTAGAIGEEAVNLLEQLQINGKCRNE